jgi:hydroxylamine reductase (hybrid-cluster protein)
VWSCRRTASLFSTLTNVNFAADRFVGFLQQAQDMRGG